MTEARKPSRLVSILGWYGMLAVTLAYGLNARGYLEPGLLYQSLNASGALALLVLCHVKRDWPTLTLEAVWLVASLVGLLGAL